MLWSVWPRTAGLDITKCIRLPHIPVAPPEQTVRSRWRPARRFCSKFWCRSPWAFSLSSPWAILARPDLITVWDGHVDDGGLLTDGWVECMKDFCHSVPFSVWTAVRIGPRLVTVLDFEQEPWIFASRTPDG